MYWLRDYARAIEDSTFESTYVFVENAAFSIPRPTQQDKSSDDNRRNIDRDYKGSHDCMIMARDSVKDHSEAEDKNDHCHGCSIASIHALLWSRYHITRYDTKTTVVKYYLQTTMRMMTRIWMEKDALIVWICMLSVSVNA
jgi:hypothetical protein